MKQLIHNEDQGGWGGLGDILSLNAAFAGNFWGKHQAPIWEQEDGLPSLPVASKESLLACRNHSQGFRQWALQFGLSLGMDKHLPLTAPPPSPRNKISHVQGHAPVAWLTWAGRTEAGLSEGLC